VGDQKVGDLVGFANVRIRPKAAIPRALGDPSQAITKVAKFAASTNQEKVFAVLNNRLLGHDLAECFAQHAASNAL
jgi:hypothetical protein